MRPSSCKQRHMVPDMLIFDKSYRGEGDTQGGKMFWGGAFAMKSAIRQSSFEADRSALQERLISG